MGFRDSSLLRAKDDHHQLNKEFNQKIDLLAKDLAESKIQVDDKIDKKQELRDKLIDFGFFSNVCSLNIQDLSQDSAIEEHDTLIDDLECLVVKAKECRDLSRELSI